MFLTVLDFVEVMRLLDEDKNVEVVVRLIPMVAVWGDRKEWTWMDLDNI